MRMPVFQVRRVHNHGAVRLKSVSPRALRMMKWKWVNGDVADSGRPFANFGELGSSGEEVKTERIIRLRHQSFKKFPGCRRRSPRVDGDPIVALKQRHEKRQALNVVPMKKRNSEMEIWVSIVEPLHQRKAHGPKC